MAKLIEDIKTQSEWTVNSFKTEGMVLDYSIESFIEIDRFIQKYTKDGQPIQGRPISKNPGGIIFSIGSYVGETIIRNTSDSRWETNDNDPKGEINIEVVVKDETRYWPVQRVIKRIQNGLEDGIYPYGYNLIDKFQNVKFDKSFWEIEKEVKPVEPKKPWWKF